MTPMINPLEMWPNTMPQLTAKMYDGETTWHEPIVGWAHRRDQLVGLNVMEPLLVEPVTKRHLVFASDVDSFQSIENAGDGVRRVRASLDMLNETLQGIQASISM